MLDSDSTSSVPQKHCNTCPEGQQWHDATPDYFSRNRSKKDKLSSQCKECEEKKAKLYYEQKKAHLLEKNKIYREDNRQQIKEQKHLYYQAHRQENKARGQAYNASHQEEIRLQKRLYNERHREQRREKSKFYQRGDVSQAYQKRRYQEKRQEIRQQRRLYYLAHLEEFGERTRRYRQSEQGRILYQKRRANEKNAPGTLTSEQVRNKLKAQRYRCYYCLCKLAKQKGRYIYHLEHTIPLSRTECNPRHDMNYVVLSCPTCNLKKHTRLPHEWAEGGRLF